VSLVGLVLVEAGVIKFVRPTEIKLTPLRNKSECECVLNVWHCILYLTFLAACSLIFTYFFLFLNATLAFCFWMSTLFSRSKVSSEKICT